MSMVTELRILIADDHPVVLSGLQSILSGRPGLRLVASCSTGTETLEAVNAERPDIAILDIDMPGVNGVEILKAITAAKIPTRVILLTATLRDDQAKHAADSGAFGIILKHTASEHLLDCLWAVARGERWIPPDISAAIARASQLGALHVSASMLSEREREIADTVVAGLSNKVIARKLNLSEGTVKVHLYNIYRKLNISNRTELATFIQREGGLVRKS
jgi:DNA-binding NarL/FixJ family response regulator